MAKIDSKIKEYNYPKGDIQRVQVVKGESFDDLEFVKPSFSKEAFDALCNFLENTMIPKAPWLFGVLVLFHLPSDIDVPFEISEKEYGYIKDPKIIASIGIKKRMIGDRFVSPLKEEQQFFNELSEQGLVRIIKGKRNKVTCMPVSDNFGYLSETEESGVKLNANFFTIDSFDCETPYDICGIPIGLAVKNGEVFSPPLFEREALIVRNGKTSVEIPSLRKMKLEIRGKEYIHGENCRIILRPESKRTPEINGTDYVIVGTKVVAVHRGGKTQIPCSGFVMQIQDGRGEGTGLYGFSGKSNISCQDDVIYHGFEDVTFAIQAGNSILKNAVATKGFISKFYNIKNPFAVPYPPHFYPLNYEKSRAARMALGSGYDGKPVFVWAEGASKLKYIVGADSRGATLADMVEFCRDFGLVNAINLDGGGSAQIMINNKRYMKISDRKNNNSESERGIPLGIKMI